MRYVTHQQSRGGGDISVKNDNIVRIYFQNINSCGFAKGADKWGKIIESMSIGECDFINVAQTIVLIGIFSAIGIICMTKFDTKCQLINSLHAETDLYLNNLCCQVALHKLSELIGRVVLLQQSKIVRAWACGAEVKFG